MPAVMPKTKEDSIIRIAAACLHCANLQAHGYPVYNADQESQWTCKAFPAGIPPLLGEQEYSHEEVYPGDNDIRYKPQIIIPEGKKIGYYFDWDGNAFDAKTRLPIQFYSEVR